MDIKTDYKLTFSAHIHTASSLLNVFLIKTLKCFNTLVKTVFKLLEKLSCFEAKILETV